MKTRGTPGIQGPGGGFNTLGDIFKTHTIRRLV